MFKRINAVKPPLDSLACRIYWDIGGSIGRTGYIIFRLMSSFVYNHPKTRIIKILEIYLNNM